MEIPLATVMSLCEADDADSSVRAALLFCLGEYKRQLLPEKVVKRIETHLPRLRDDGDAEVHAAALWLGSRWKLGQVFRDEPARPPQSANWYCAGAGHEMVAVRSCLDHDFALATAETTVVQFGEFDQQYKSAFRSDLDQFLDQKHVDQCPAICINYYDAMRYCNWLTRKHGLDETQCCYEVTADGRLRPRPGHVTLRGFRLPTLAEWRCGCRAGSATTFSFGDNVALLPDYAWYFSNSRAEGQHRARAVGTTKPNALGLFDTYGNVWEWVTNLEQPDLPLLCGGSCDNEPQDLRWLDREKGFSPENRQIRIGFRLAQTLRESKP
jgi:formylglycine-generating enzyme required for sulfatase activity